MLDPGGAQQIRRTAATVAKRAVMPDDDVRHADRPEQHVLDKRSGALLGKGHVEMLDEQESDPEPRDLAPLDPERGQPKRLALGHEDTARVRLEGGHRRRHAIGAGAIARLADQRGMTLMQPGVEIAHRQHCAARMA